MGKLSGFPELLPAQRAAELRIIDQLRRVFELHGFANLQTRAVEPVAELMRKGEIDKEVYAIRRLQAADPAEEADGLALHFDLTVPLARYVVDHAAALDFPFRRYQIQKVWRGERPQQGRYREFTQADIDVVGRDNLPFHVDVEVAKVMAHALGELTSSLHAPRFTLQISNRKILEGFYLGLGIVDPVAVMQAVDKLDKVSPEGVRTILLEQGVSADQADQVLALSAIEGATTADRDISERVRALGVEHDLLSEGLAELAQVVDGCAEIAAVDVVANLRIARGLDYYTGTVFETVMAGYEQLGSVCSGGRYDALARDNRSTYPGVGLSLGLSRLIIALLCDGLSASRPVPSAVLVAVNEESSRSVSEAAADALRSRGIATEVAVSAQKFGKQIRQAQRRAIPFVLFPRTDAGQRAQIKDIRSGAQSEIDLDTWEPPEVDREPQIGFPAPSAQPPIEEIAP